MSVFKYRKGDILVHNVHFEHTYLVKDLLPNSRYHIEYLHPLDIQAVIGARNGSPTYVGSVRAIESMTHLSLEHLFKKL